MVSKRVIFGRFYFWFGLIFYILGAFLMKQLFYSRLLDMSRTGLVGYLPSHIRRALME